MSIDFTKPLQSDGIPMRLLCIDAPGEYPVVCLSPSGVPNTFTLDGKFVLGCNEKHPKNLTNVSEQVTVDVMGNNTKLRGEIRNLQKLLCDANHQRDAALRHLDHILLWDCLNPPDPSLGADRPRLKLELLKLRAILVPKEGK